MKEVQVEKPKKEQKPRTVASYVVEWALTLAAVAAVAAGVVWVWKWALGV